MKRLLLLFLLLCIALLDSFAQSNVLVFTHVTVIDATGKPPEEDMTVVIRGNLIAAISKTGIKGIPETARVIDASGKYLIPGLWDAHVHLFNHITAAPPNQYYFPLFIANGVTSVRDLWVKLDEIKQVQDWRNKLERDELTIPRIASVGTLVDGEDPIWPNADTVADADEARQMVDRIKGAGMDFVKVYWNLSREEYLAIADEAKKQNISFEGHVPFAVRAVEASDAGQRSIEHLTEIQLNCSGKEDELRAIDAEKWNTADDQKVLDSYDQQKCKNVIFHFVKNGTWQVPTLVMFHKLNSTEKDLLNDKRLNYIPAGEKENWKSFIQQLKKRSPEKVKYGKDYWNANLNLVSEMHKAGIDFMAGTDVSIDNSFIYPGFSLHDELVYFVEAGFTPMEAIQAATRNPAKFMGKLDTLGTLEEGKLADMVLLDANPIEDIQNTRKIHAVVLNGKLYDHEALQEFLMDAETAAKKKSN
jgi:imidazolonepropionase-like amidohydrolase